MQPATEQQVPSPDETEDQDLELTIQLPDIDFSDMFTANGFISGLLLSISSSEEQGAKCLMAVRTRAHTPLQPSRLMHACIPPQPSWPQLEGGVTQLWTCPALSGNPYTMASCPAAQ